MFSVIMPAYNAGKFISTSISSVLNQTCKNFELIVVDDGSKDNTQEVVQSFRDSRVVYIYQENCGVSAARNTGILSSKGEYICFLDSDDEWKENHLAVLSDLISEFSDCGFYGTGYDVRLINGEVIEQSRNYLKNVPNEVFRSEDGYGLLLKYGYFVNTNSICCRRDAIDKVGLFTVGVKNGEDDDMWMRIFAYYDVAVSKTVTTIYNRGNSVATGKRMNVENVFLDRIDGILMDETVSDQKKESLLIWRERELLSQCRNLVIEGKKRQAKKLFRKVRFSLAPKKSYLITLGCFVLPTKFVRSYYDRRDRAYYSN